jgi:hypothetical protein
MLDLRDGPAHGVVVFVFVLFFAYFGVSLVVPSVADQRFFDFTYMYLVGTRGLKAVGFCDITVSSPWLCSNPIFSFHLRMGL